MRNLVYTGGIFHDFPRMAAALDQELAQIGVQSVISTDIEDCARRLEAGEFDVFTVYALRWRMLDAEKYEPYRNEWGLETTSEVRGAIQNFVASGGGLLALHTASICFDDWPEWKVMIGGGWSWGKSLHPPLQSIKVRVADLSHPLTHGLGGFEIVDEVYQLLDVRDDCHVLLEVAGEANEKAHPQAWTCGYGKGRVFCDTLGHDTASIQHPTHAGILKRAIAWAAGTS